MLIVAGALAVAWLIAVATAFTLGGLIHLLVIAAAVMIVIKIVDRWEARTPAGPPRRFYAGRQ